MAEILVCVTSERRPDERFQDGDIIHAPLTCDCEFVHAANICNMRAVSKNGEGLRVLGTLGHRWCEIMHQYRFERISATEVRRTNLWTQEVDIVSNRPNERGEQIRVAEFLAHRLRNPEHQIFGRAGSEIWYGGPLRDPSGAVMTAVWNMLETHSPHRRVDHQRWPATERERRKFLRLPIPELSRERVSRVTAVEWDFDRRQPEFKTKQTRGQRIARQRRVRVNWRDTLPARVSVEDVLNDAIEVDAVPHLSPLVVRGVIEIKPRKNIWAERAHLRSLLDVERRF